MKTTTALILFAAPTPALAISVDASNIVVGGVGIVFAAVGTLVMRQIAEFERRVTKLEELPERVARLEASADEGRKR